MYSSTGVGVPDGDCWIRGFVDEGKEHGSFFMHWLMMSALRKKLVNKEVITNVGYRCTKQSVSHC